jgi:hypothetical protein
MQQMFGSGGSAAASLAASFSPWVTSFSSPSPNSLSPGGGMMDLGVGGAVHGGIPFGYHVPSGVTVPSASPQGAANNKKATRPFKVKPYLIYSFLI